MSYQESQLLQLQDLQHLSMLRLSPTSPTPPPTTTTTLTPPTTTTTAKPCPRFKKCRECGTLKRRSPSSLHQEPSHKKHNLHLPPSTTTTTTTNGSDEPINTTPWNVTPPPKQAPLVGLNRCISEPIYYDEVPLFGTEKGSGCGGSSANLGKMVGNAISPENSKTPTTSSSPSSALLRSISDPTVACAPLQHVPRSLPPLSPVSEESPDSKRLKRMRNRMKEMKKWVGELMKEEEDDEDHISDHNTDNNSKDETESDHQEAVWVEKKGDGLVIHFKCPCGEGYEIFLFGNNCYYKLIHRGKGSKPRRALCRHTDRLEREDITADRLIKLFL